MCSLSVGKCVQLLHARGARIFVYRQLFEAVDLLAVVAIGTRTVVTGGLVPRVAREQGPVLLRQSVASNISIGTYGY